MEENEKRIPMEKGLWRVAGQTSWGKEDIFNMETVEKIITTQNSKLLLALGYTYRYIGLHTVRSGLV